MCIEGVMLKIIVPRGKQSNPITLSLRSTTDWIPARKSTCID